MLGKIRHQVEKTKIPTVSNSEMYELLLLSEPYFILGHLGSTIEPDTTVKSKIFKRNDDAMKENLFG